MKRKDRPRLRMASPWPWAALGLLILIALSIQSAFFLALALLTGLTLLASTVSVLWAGRSLRAEAALGQKRVLRGEAVPLGIRVTHSCPLPLGGMTLTLESGAGGEDLRVTDVPRESRYEAQVSAAHVGVAHPGLRQITVSDLFDLNACEVPVRMAGDELLVLPRTFDMEPLRYAPADPGLGTMARATEDLTDPMDVRSYQPGDPMKKIHWKLSARKREAVIRRFEEPVQPEALILMDAVEPPTAFHRDALLETAASLIRSESASGRSVRLPLYGSRPTELTERMGMPLVLEALARAELTETDRFERILEMEARRLRRSGALAVLTCRLTSSLVDALTRMRRISPPIRVFLITSTPDHPALLPLITQLQQGGVEIGYVRCEG